MLTRKIKDAGKKSKTECNSSIPEALKPFYLPHETVEKLKTSAGKIGIPVEALVCSILQEAI